VKDTAPTAPPHDKSRVHIHTTKSPAEPARGEDEPQRAQLLPRLPQDAVLHAGRRQEGLGHAQRCACAVRRRRRARASGLSSAQPCRRSSRPRSPRPPPSSVPSGTAGRRPRCRRTSLTQARSGSRRVINFYHVQEHTKQQTRIRTNKRLELL